jgi:hypothetical protein
MVEVDRAKRHDEQNRYDEPRQSKPTEQPQAPVATPESARTALQQSMDRRW